MKIRTYSLFPLMVLGLLAGLTFWLQRAIQSEREAPKDKGRHEVDFVVEDFVARKLDPQGNLMYTLAAQKMLHYADDEDTEVIQPRLTYFGDPPSMHLRSRLAIINKDRSVVDLRDDVQAVREATAQDPELVLHTSQLTVYPDEEVASTKEPVKIVYGPSVLTGVGMDMDNKVRTFRLHDQVSGTFHRRPPK